MLLTETVLVAKLQLHFIDFKTEVWWLQLGDQLGGSWDLVTRTTTSEQREL